MMPGVQGLTYLPRPAPPTQCGYDGYTTTHQAPWPTTPSAVTVGGWETRTRGHTVQLITTSTYLVSGLYLLVLLNANLFLISLIIIIIIIIIICFSVYHMAVKLTSPFLFLIKKNCIKMFAT